MERETYAVRLQSSGYVTFYAGKYLNEYGSNKVNNLHGGLKMIPIHIKKSFALKYRMILRPFFRQKKLRYSHIQI
jgi:hypothetical protein